MLLNLGQTKTDKIWYRKIDKRLTHTKSDVICSLSPCYAYGFGITRASVRDRDQKDQSMRASPPASSARQGRHGRRRVPVLAVAGRPGRATLCLAEFHALCVRK